jgi:FixJ family two-component response regulator
MSAVAPLVRIVDDDRAFLSAVARLLRAAGFAVRTFSSAEGLLAALDSDVPGCVLADLRMPGVDGLQLQAAIAGSSNPLPIVFLSGRGDIPAAVRAMRGGAEDFLTKTAPKAELLGAVRRALERDARDRRSRAHQSELRARFAQLTARELEVLVQVVSGKLNKQIADHLGIHERTVKLHRTSLTGKLGVHSVAELTRLAQEAGLFPPDDATPPSEGATA